MSHRAFTLIELLVVVSLIVLLVALLMPALGRVRAIGVDLACASNVKQLGNAFHAFAEDHGDRFPAYWDNTEHSATGPVIHWQVTIGQQYMGEPAVGYDLPETIWRSPLHCPADKEVFYLWNRPVRCIAINGTINPGMLSYPRPHGMTNRMRRAVDHPSEACLGGDGASGAAIGLGMSEWGSAARYYDISGATPISAFVRHSGRMNFVHVDLHVEAHDETWVAQKTSTANTNTFFDWQALN